MSETAVVQPFTLERDDYDLTVEAAVVLGITEQPAYQIPSFEEVTARITDRIALYAGAQVVRGEASDLRLDIPFTPGYTFNNMVATFDRGQQQPTKVLTALWDKVYTEPNASDHSVIIPSLALNDMTSPENRMLLANEFNEPGLVFPDMSMDAQVKQHLEERLQTTRHGLRVDYLTFTEYMIGQTKRRIAGLPPLDQHTVTRFSREEEWDYEEAPVAPCATIGADGNLCLSASSIDAATANTGIRRVIRL